MTGDDTARSELDEVDRDLATAFGLYAFSDASIHEAADAAGVSPWTLEDEIERAGLAELVEVEETRDVSSTIDRLFEDETG